MVDVDLICAKGQVDAGVQVSEGWSKSREMSCEAEGSKQIGVCLSRGVDECRYSRRIGGCWG